MGVFDQIFSSTKREVETHAWRQQLKEFDARREAFWDRVGTDKEMTLTLYDAEEFYYAVSVNWSISSDGKSPSIEITISSDSYPSKLLIDPKSALELLQQLDQVCNTSTPPELFSIEGMSMGRPSHFRLNYETVCNLIKWLKQEKTTLEQEQNA